MCGGVVLEKIHLPFPHDVSRLAVWFVVAFTALDEFRKLMRTVAYLNKKKPTKLKSIKKEYYVLF
jgi:hypothetical protein